MTWCTRRRPWPPAAPPGSARSPPAGRAPAAAAGPPSPRCAHTRPAHWRPGGARRPGRPCGRARAGGRGREGWGRVHGAGGAAQARVAGRQAAGQAAGQATAGAPSHRGSVPPCASPCLAYGALLPAAPHLKSGVRHSMRVEGLRALSAPTVRAKWSAPPSGRSSRSTDVSTTYPTPQSATACGAGRRGTGAGRWARARRGVEGMASTAHPVPLAPCSPAAAGSRGPPPPG